MRKDSSVRGRWGVRVEEGLRGSEIWVTVSQWQFPRHQRSGLEVFYLQR